MRRYTARGLSLNPKILEENPVSLLHVPRAMKISYGTAYSLITRGRRSPVTGRIVRLECCYLGNGAMATSPAAYDRYVQAFNGMTKDAKDEMKNRE